MTGWVIVVVFDGPIAIEVRGDRHGEPFPTQAEAQAAADGFQRTGVRYSIYVSQVKRLDGGS